MGLRKRRWPGTLMVFVPERRADRLVPLARPAADPIERDHGPAQTSRLEPIAWGLHEGEEAAR